MCVKLTCLICLALALGLCVSTAGAQENQIINGEFDDGLSSWNYYGATGFTLQIVPGAGLSGNHALLMDVTDASATSSIGIAQGGLELVQGQTYQIGFTAKAEQEREMVVLFQIYKPEIPQWLTPWETKVPLTTSAQSFKFEYSHGSETTAEHTNWSVDIYLMLKGAWWPMAGSDLNKKVWVDRVYFGTEPPPQSVVRATNPSPPDGAIHADTWVSLSWSPGDFAVSHDVYLGDNFDDVNEGVGDTFRGSQVATFYVAGFPGFAYPDGLVPGTTYYWRIDEVNNLHLDSPWTGDLWRFTVPPRQAHKPRPASGAKFIDPNTTLGWSAGYGAKLHHLYFGRNAADVEAGTAGTYKGPLVETRFVPGTLEREKTYYWRVDEFDGLTTHKGDLWSFTIAKAGGGVKGEYFNNTMLSGEPVLTRVDPQINFNWGGGDVRGVNSPAESINVDNFSARWSGKLEVDLTDTYIFHITANNGFRLWLDGEIIIDFWDNPTTSSRQSEPIELVGGDMYAIRMEYYEGTGTAIAQLSWESTAREEEIIPRAALSLPVKAGSPRPTNGATGTTMTPILTWSAGDFAASHEVYFGTDADAVKNAAKTSPEYRGAKALGDESYEPGKLAWDTTYYWRVDEVNGVHPNSPWVGSLWSFTTAEFLLVDDFEAYDAGDNQIWYSWHDGLGYGTPATPPYFAGNGTGAAVGDETTPSYTEENIVHGGLQSMPLSYDNNKQGFAKYSEVELTLAAARDWTEEGVAELSLWFRGDSVNAAEPLYVAVSNSTGRSAVVVHDDANAAKKGTWTEWVVPLQTLANQGINLKNVDRIAIGLGARGNMTTPGGSGKMYIDDIRLYRPRTAP